MLILTCQGINCVCDHLELLIAIKVINLNFLFEWKVVQNFNLSSDEVRMLREVPFRALFEGML